MYMLPSEMNLNIRLGTAGYNNKILVSDSLFSLGRNDMVNASVPEKMSHNIVLKHAHQTSIIPKHAHKEVPSKHISAITHEGAKITLALVLTSGNMVRFPIMRSTRRGYCI